MRRLTVLAVSIVVSIAVLSLAPGAGAQLPKDKAPSWQASLDGDLQQVAVCEGSTCASSRVSASTSNSLTGGDANLYAFPRDGETFWAWDVGGGSDFAMTGTDVTDDGGLVVGVSDRMADQGLGEDAHGPFWTRDADPQGEIQARGDTTDIENASSDDDGKLATWLPGRDAFAMIKDPAATDQEGRVWVYTGGQGSEPYQDWTPAGQLVGADGAVDVAATSELVVSGFNQGGTAKVALFEAVDPGVSDRLDSEDGLDSTLNALDASRSGNVIVAGMGDDRAVVFRANVTAAGIEVERVRTLLTEEPVTSVAVSADGSRLALGGGFGIFSYERTDDEDQPYTRAWSWSQSVNGLDMSQDGRYVVATDASGLRSFWNAAPEGTVQLWRSDIGGTPLSVDTGYAGSGTIVGDDAGDVHFFDLDHSLGLVIDPNSMRLQPGKANEFTLTLDNEGDAVQDITLSATGGQADWVTFRTENGTGAPLSGVDVLPDETRTVTVEVTPPPGTSAGSSFAATIHATVDSSPDDATETVSISGSVEESHGVNLAADPPSLNIEQGAMQTVDLTVTNAGNLQDTIVIEIGSMAEGWTTTIGRNSFSLAAGASENTTLTVQAPDRADQGVTEDVDVLGTSQGDTSEQARLTIPATIGPTQAVSLSGPATVEARAGEATPIDVTVENVGNQASTFELSLEAPGTWGATVSSDSVTLATGETTDETVTVTPPADASGSATVTLSAVAQGDPSVASERRIVVRVTHGFLGLPGFGSAAAVAAIAAGLWAVSRRRR